MKRTMIALSVLALFLFGTGFTLPEGYGWNDHDPPFSFLFGNHIDTHQQSLVTRKGTLEGFFYITFTGEYTADGVPIATHGNCSSAPDACSVGWILHGVPVTATYLGHRSGQHPEWQVEASDLLRGYSHFHWLGAPEHADGLVVGQAYEGYVLKLSARETFFFDHHGGFLVTPGIDRATHANIVTE